MHITFRIHAFKLFSMNPPCFKLRLYANVRLKVLPYKIKGFTLCYVMSMKLHLLLENKVITIKKKNLTNIRVESTGNMNTQENSTITI